MKNIYFIIIAIFVILYILYSIRKEKLRVKASFEWIFASIVILFLAIFPYSFDKLAYLLGVSYPPALMLTLAIIFLIIINFNHSKKITELEEKVIFLSEEISILKEKNKHK